MHRVPLCELLSASSPELTRQRQIQMIEREQSAVALRVTCYVLGLGRSGLAFPDSSFIAASRFDLGLAQLQEDEREGNGRVDGDVHCSHIMYRSLLASGPPSTTSLRASTAA